MESVLPQCVIETKVVVLRAFMQCGLSSHPLLAHHCVTILLSEKHASLLAMCQLLDNQPNLFSLHRLVYQSITDDTLRDKALAHLRAFSFPQPSSLTGYVRPCGVKIFSDVDDTLACSGGLFPAGIDNRYPRHTIYPGGLLLRPCVHLSHLQSSPSIVS